MINRISYWIILLALITLGLAGLLLMIGASPDSYMANYQAEVLADHAYPWLVIGWLIRLISDWRFLKD